MIKAAEGVSGSAASDRFLLEQSEERGQQTEEAWNTLTGSAGSESAGEGSNIRGQAPLRRLCRAHFLSGPGRGLQLRDALDTGARGGEGQGRGGGGWKSSRLRRRVDIGSSVMPPGPAMDQTCDTDGGPPSHLHHPPYQVLNHQVNKQFDTQ